MEVVTDIESTNQITKLLKQLNYGNVLFGLFKVLN